MSSLRLCTMAVLLGLGVAVACSDDGTSPAGLSMSDLAGAWEADSFVFTNFEDPNTSADLVAMGAFVVLIIDRDGNWTQVVSGSQDGQALQSVQTGTGTIRGDTLTVLEDGAATVNRLAVLLVGDVLRLTSDEASWDFDFDADPNTPDDPARLRLVLHRT